MTKRSNGIILSYTYTFFNMICGLLMSSFLLRQLGDTEYGLYQAVTAFATYLVMLEFGTGTVMSRNISLCRGKGEDEKIKNNISTLWYTAIFLSVLIAFVSFVFCINIGNIYKNSMTDVQVAYAKKIFVVITIYLIASFLTNTLNGLLLGMEHYTFAQKTNIVKIISRTALLVVLVSLKPNAMSIVFVDLLIGCSIFLFTFFYCKNKYKIKLKFSYFDAEILKNSLPLCFALLLQALINQANTSIGKFIIGIRLSLESVALYSVAQYLYNIIASISTIPISMYLPQVAKDMSSGLKGKALTEKLVEPCRLVVIISGTVLCGFFAVGKPFIELFYGANKKDAWIYALILIVPMFVNMTVGILINVLDVANKRLTRSLSLMGTTILNIILTIFLIDKFNVLGAAIGTSVSLILGNILVMGIYYKKVMHIEIIWLYLQAYKGILPFQISSALIAFLISNILNNVYLSFLLGGILYVVLCGTLIILFGLRNEEKERLYLLVSKFKK